MIRWYLLILFFLVFVSVNNSLARPAGNYSVDGFKYGFAASFENSFENSFDTEMEEGGEFGFYRFSIESSLERSLNTKTSIDLGFDYSYTSFDFSGSEGFPALDPWEDINRVGLGVSIRHSLNNKWTFMISPEINFSGEAGAEIGDSLTYRGIAGFTYNINKDLFVGTGIIATTRIEDDFIAFPGAILNWRINEKLILSSIISNVRTELGPRLTINYFANRKLSGSLSIGYEFRRFRLDDEGVAPDGVGDIKLMPVWVSAGYNLTDYARAEIYTGTAFFGELELEDRKGDRIQKDDFEPLIFVGAGLKLKL